jgi:hypothetical protein
MTSTPSGLKGAPTPVFKPAVHSDIGWILDVPDLMFVTCATQDKDKEGPR